MIRLILEGGTWFSISPDSYPLAVEALDYSTSKVIDLNLVAGGAIVVNSKHIIGVTRQSEAELESAWEHEFHLDNLQKEVLNAMTPDWE